MQEPGALGERDKKRLGIDPEKEPSAGIPAEGFVLSGAIQRSA